MEKRESKRTTDTNESEVTNQGQALCNPIDLLPYPVVFGVKVCYYGKEGSTNMIKRQL